LQDVDMCQRRRGLAHAKTLACSGLPAAHQATVPSAGEGRLKLPTKSGCGSPIGPPDVVGCASWSGRAQERTPEQARRFLRKWFGSPSWYANERYCADMRKRLGIPDVHPPSPYLDPPPPDRDTEGEGP
jgi:hypothetical protein